jgi:hypothetical protein
MSRYIYYFFGLGAGLILVTAAAQPATASPPDKHYRSGVSAVGIGRTDYRAKIKPYPDYKWNRPIGSDWWRTYPWSRYNAWRNPYWYPPYNANYPFPPDQAYPYPYPMPQPYPVPIPWDGIGSANR